ncbi:MAG TPA: branched-chain amino acid ABC transporter permease [Methylomirabilota bacterium]|nr:branched-chain amino acid ABC transporter permease [Methylomirabilota bacterium]
MSPRPRRGVGGAAPTLLALVLVGLGPLVIARQDRLNLGVVFFLAVALAQSWNVMGGLTGQVNLGHAAFFGLGALVTRQLWGGGAPIAPAALAGSAVAAAAGLVIGVAAFRLRGAYFAIGTLAVGEGLRIVIGNLFPEVSTLPAPAIVGYRLTHRYAAAAVLALLATTVVAALEGSRLGLAMAAIREDEAAAEASGVSAFRTKLAAVAISTALAGLAGALFAFYQISYYPQHPFSPTWTFDAVLITFIGGVGTVQGPVLGAALLVLLRDYLTVQWVDVHLLVFGVLFVAIVLLLPGGLVEAAARARALRGRLRGAPAAPGIPRP